MTFHGRQTGVSRLALGLFTFRVPFYHTRLCWSEFLQGLFVSAATGLALIPVMTAFFGLSFEEAVALSMIHASLIASAVIVFGEPYAGGWITPALPLILAFVIGGYEDPVSRFQAMTTLSLVFATLVLFLGITGLGKRFVIWLPIPSRRALFWVPRLPRSSGSSWMTPNAFCLSSPLPRVLPAPSA